MPLVKNFVRSYQVAGTPNAATTLTIGAYGEAGIYTYVTRLWIARIATAALAGGAILSITTTNWFLNATWRTGNLIAAGQQIVDLDALFDPPMKANTSNTVITVVCPAAGAAVSWHLEAHIYYNG